MKKKKNKKSVCEVCGKRAFTWVRDYFSWSRDGILHNELVKGSGHHFCKKHSRPPQGVE